MNNNAFLKLLFCVVKKLKLGINFDLIKSIKKSNLNYKQMIHFLKLIILLFLTSSCREFKKNEMIKNSEETKTLQILLIGTFHFENYNPENNGDLVNIKIPNVLTPKNQAELEKIAKRISIFNPDKIFVEYPFKKQEKLDSIYKLFPEHADFKNQKRNEINQIGFRVAKQLKHTKVYCMDMKTDFPYDSLLTQMKIAKQFDLIKKDEEELDKLEEKGNKLFNSDKTLSEIIYYFNEEEYRKNDINWYVNLANQGGDKENFVGAYIASEWYKRNLYMYSIIQKAVEKGDNKIMILAGSSHIGMFKEFISYNPEWKTVELKEIMK